jgi:hypothetical protein
MNERIELHDSNLAAVTISGEEAVVSFAPAYIHRSAGRPGVDAGTGWWQQAMLTFAGASLHSQPGKIPATVSEGYLRIGSKSHSNIIPANGDFHGAIEFSIRLCTAESLILRAQHVRIRLLGEASFGEDFIR